MNAEQMRDKMVLVAQTLPLGMLDGKRKITISNDGDRVRVTFDPPMPAIGSRAA